MKKFINKNIHLILVFGIPLSLVLIVTIFIYMPSVFLKSNYDFIYVSCGDNYSNNCYDYMKRKYSVEEGKLSINYINKNADYDNNGRPDFSKEYKVRIFLYDNKKNESREITKEEAQNFYLSDLITSPEGISITNKYSGGVGFFPVFDTRSSYNYYLTKGNSKKKLNLMFGDNSYRRNNFQFIGWVINK